MRSMHYSPQVLELGSEHNEAAYNRGIRLEDRMAWDEESDKRCFMVEIFIECGV